MPSFLSAAVSFTRLTLPRSMFVHPVGTPVHWHIEECQGALSMPPHNTPMNPMDNRWHSTTAVPLGALAERHLYR